MRFKSTFCFPAEDTFWPTHHMPSPLASSQLTQTVRQKKMAAETRIVMCLMASPAYENILTSRCTNLSAKTDFPAPGGDPFTECKAH